MARGETPRAGRGVAIDHDLGAKATVLLVGSNVLQLRQLLHGFHQLWAPLVEVRKLVRGERVDVLR